MKTYSLLFCITKKNFFEAYNMFFNFLIKSSIIIHLCSKLLDSLEPNAFKIFSPLASLLLIHKKSLSSAILSTLFKIEKKLLKETEQAFKLTLNQYNFAKEIEEV